MRVRLLWGHGNDMKTLDIYNVENVFTYEEDGVFTIAVFERKNDVCIKHSYTLEGLNACYLLSY